MIFGACEEAAPASNPMGTPPTSTDLQSETSITMVGTSPRRLIVGYNDASGVDPTTQYSIMGSATSNDCGKTWTRHPQMTPPTAPVGYSLQGDPWLVSTTSDVVLSSNNARSFPGGSDRTGLFFSTDGGLSWSTFRTIEVDPAAPNPIDREAPYDGTKLALSEAETRVLATSYHPARKRAMFAFFDLATFTFNPPAARAIDPMALGGGPPGCTQAQIKTHPIPAGGRGSTFYVAALVEYRDGCAPAEFYDVFRTSDFGSTWTRIAHLPAPAHYDRFYAVPQVSRDNVRPSMAVTRGILVDGAPPPASWQPTEDVEIGVAEADVVWLAFPVGGAMMHTGTQRVHLISVRGADTCGSGSCVIRDRRVDDLTSVVDFQEDIGIALASHEGHYELQPSVYSIAAGVRGRSATGTALGLSFYIQPQVGVPGTADEVRSLTYVVAVGSPTPELGLGYAAIISGDIPGVPREPLLVDAGPAFRPCVTSTPPYYFSDYHQGALQVEVASGSAYPLLWGVVAFNDSRQGCNGGDRWNLRSNHVYVARTDFTSLCHWSTGCLKYHRFATGGGFFPSGWDLTCPP